MDRRWISNSSRTSHGFSLVEMITATAIFAILMLAMQSAVMLSVKSMPDNGSRASQLTAESRVLNRIAQDLHYATSVTMANNRTLQMVVADQDGDGASETITYQWDGTAGTTLTRTRNGGAASTIASSLRNFQCTMRKKSVTTSTTTYGTSTSAEQTLATFNDYGLSGTTSNTLNLSSSKYAAEYFRFSTSVVPANATSVQITRAGAWIQGLGLLGTISAEIRRAVGNGTYTPSTIRYGSASDIGSSLLSLSLGWTVFPFNDVFITNPQEELELVLTSNAFLSIASVQYRYNASGPADTPKLFWSNDGGSSWSPSSSLNAQDMKFTIYGTVTTPTVSTTTTTRYYLTGVDLRLCLGTRDTDAVELSVSTPNQPEVAGP